VAPFRIFCFPYAGGSSWIFRQLASQLRERAEIIAVDLPGRGRRRTEACIDEWPEVRDRLVAELAPTMREPYALLGYSAGALVALDLARELARRGVNAARPSALFACALRGPRLIRHPQLLHRMEDRPMFEALRELGGIPDELLDMPELIALSAPAMRADLRLFETYEPAQPPLEDVPVHAYYGRNDHSVGDGYLAWQHETHAGFQARAFDGGHMFLHDDAIAFGDALIADLTAVAVRDRVNRWQDAASGGETPAGPARAANLTQIREA